jgi:hypothetical protein
MRCPPGKPRVRASRERRELAAHALEKWWGFGSSVHLPARPRSFRRVQEASGASKKLPIRSRLPDTCENRRSEQVVASCDATPGRPAPKPASFPPNRKPPGHAGSFLGAPEASRSPRAALRVARIASTRHRKLRARRGGFRGRVYAGSSGSAGRSGDFLAAKPRRIR